MDATGGPEVQQDGPGQHPGHASRSCRQHEHVLRAFVFPSDLDGHQHVSARVSLSRLSLILVRFLETPSFIFGVLVRDEG